MLGTPKKGFHSKAEAVLYASKLEILAQEQLIENPNKFVFAHYFENWCYTYKIGRYSKSTDIKYEREIKYVHDYFKDTDIKDVTRQMYQEYLNYRGKGNGKDTVDKVHSKLKSCLQLALADGIIKQDPTFGAIKRYDKPASKRAKYINYTDYEKLLLFLESSDNIYDFMIYISIITGLRIGEVYGLSYDDITEETLTVKRGYDYNYTKSFTDCKNESSKRTIIIPRNMHRKMLQYKLKNQIINERYLFLDNLNKPIITHTGLTKHFHKILSTLKIERINLHGLRHTHASVLIFKDFNLNYISKRLGHANTTETLETYTHVLAEHEQKQNDKIIDFLSSATL